MASIDKINVKGTEYVINEGRWTQNEANWSSLGKVSVTLGKEGNATLTSCECYAIPKLRICFITATVSHSITYNPETSYLIASIPTGYRPKNKTPLYGAIAGTSAIALEAQPAGTINAYPKVSSFRGDFTFGGFWFY